MLLNGLRNLLRCFNLDGLADAVVVVDGEDDASESVSEIYRICFYSRRVMKF